MNIDDILLKKIGLYGVAAEIDDNYILTVGVAKEAIKEIVEKTLQMAAENAKTELTSTSIRVHKDSIINTINQITF